MKPYLFALLSLCLLSACSPASEDSLAEVPQQVERQDTIQTFCPLAIPYAGQDDVDAMLLKIVSTFNRLEDPLVEIHGTKSVEAKGASYSLEYDFSARGKPTVNYEFNFYGAETPKCIQFSLVNRELTLSTQIGPEFVTESLNVASFSPQEDKTHAAFIIHKGWKKSEVYHLRQRWQRIAEM